VLQGTLQGRAVKIAFNTGAPLGYLPRGRMNGVGRTGSVQRDHIAMSQQWHETEVWSLRLGLAGREETLHWGEFPVPFDGLFARTATDGIFGGELCLTHAVTLEAHADNLWIE
jgi:hypothetical protein